MSEMRRWWTKLMKFFIFSTAEMCIWLNGRFGQAREGKGMAENNTTTSSVSWNSIEIALIDVVVDRNGDTATFWDFLFQEFIAVISFLLGFEYFRGSF